VLLGKGLWCGVSLITDAGLTAVGVSGVAVKLRLAVNVFTNVFTNYL